MKKFLVFVVYLLTVVPLFPADQTPQARLVFADDETQMTVTDQNGKNQEVQEGMALGPGWTIRTKKSSAEIALKPSGSILKLTPGTTLRITTLKDLGGAPTNDLELTAGKIRTVAAKLAGAGQVGYNIKTPNSNCGVRGTDFAVNFDPANQMDWVCVQEGAVDFTKNSTGETLSVAAGQFANTFDAQFQTQVLTSDRMKEIFSDVDFKALDPSAVNPKPQSSSPKSNTDGSTSSQKPEAQGPGGMLPDFLGLSMGAIGIDGHNYANLIFSPSIQAGQFRLSFYLPVIYTHDILNPNDWYKPQGNNEWSFGTDPSFGSDWLARTRDFAVDLGLKIRSLEWGVSTDPFYLKLGNLHDMSLGHGTVVRNFSNDQDFPSVRKIGLNTGIKVFGLKWEALADNLTAPQVIGARLAADLLGESTSLGVIAVADLNPVNSQSLANNPGYASTTAADWGDPILLVSGLDLQLFSLDWGVLKTAFFADAASMMPYYRTKIPGQNLVGQNDGYKLVYDPGSKSVKSAGGESGFMGSLFFINYRLTLGVEKGLYTNQIFQNDYYRTRIDRMQKINRYLTDPNYAQSVDKILNFDLSASASWSVFDILQLEGGYKLPFTKDDSGIHGSDNDALLVRLGVAKKKLPLVPLWGNVSYERSGFYPALRDRGNLYDAQSVFRGEVVYGGISGIDLALLFATNVVTDQSGNTVYAGELPKVSSSLTLETRVGY